jgi:protein-S-isoprenylcysteine O-methyltransferase Ste14
MVIVWPHYIWLCPVICNRCNKNRQDQLLEHFFAVGMALIATGLIIRIYSILTLKQYFIYSVAKVEDHKLIETGLYKFIRHPGYLGQLIIFLGISASLSNWLSILFMMIPTALGYLYRIKVEERFMLEQLGEDYLNYQERTKGIIPMIY